MATITEQLRDWLARAEILARGAEGRLQDALRALEAGRPWEARYEALAILDELPRSRVALALWADAAEATLLDHEAAEALERLAREVPFRADVWLRLAAARERLGLDPRAELERAAESAEPTLAADGARLKLADRDLIAGDAARAERWLDQLSLAGRAAPEALGRRIEAWLESGAHDRARAAARALPEPASSDARGWLLRGRLLALDSLAGALNALRRALLLDAPGALRIVSEELLRSNDAAARAELRALVDDLGLGKDPGFRAALASAEGRPDDALAALAEGAHTSPAVAVRYLDLALESRRPDALADAINLLASSGREPEPGLTALVRALETDDPGERLARLDGAQGRALDWAAVLRAAIYADWLPRDGAASWSRLLDEAAGIARALVSIDSLREVEAIAVDLERPLRVAIVGEFNAGKSSFINALLGETVAPVGVLPTTATVNRLVWAPDRFVRIERRAACSEPDRLVAHAELRATLAAIDLGSIERVTIYAPLEPLRRVELLDTPGFNASEARHAADARTAFRDAHAAIWLLDATQPLKESERAVLAEIDELGMPLVVLLNKLDRLQGLAQSEAALRHVREGLASAGLHVEAAPIAFSARLALAGRAGDPLAFGRSGWEEVERLFEAVLVNRSETLRERALRRKLRDVAQRLALLASEHRTERERRAQQLAGRNAALRAAAASARSHRTELEHTLESELARALEALDHDLRPVAGAEDDASTRRFIVARTRAAVGARLAEAAAGQSELGAPVAREVAIALSPRIEAAAAALAPFLRNSAAERARGENGETLASRQLVAVAADSLPEVAEGLVDERLPELGPGEIRAEALALALASTVRLEA